MSSRLLILNIETGIPRDPAGVQDCSEGSKTLRLGSPKENVRAPLGPVPSTKSRHWGRGLLVPTLSPDSVLQNPVRPIYEVKWGGVSLSGGITAYGSRKWRQSLQKYLPTVWGVSVRTAGILSGRSRSYLIQVFRNLDSLIDNLMLFDRSLFDQNNSESRSVITRFVRKVLTVSAFSIGDCIAKWKDFVNHFVTDSSDAIVSSTVSLKGNCFKFLLKEGKFQRLVKDKPSSREDYMDIAHVISTRNLANGGIKARQAAVAQFQKTTSSEFKVSSENLTKLHLVASRIGRIVTSIRGNNKMRGHCSLNGSGTLDVPVNQGGRATDALLDLKKFLSHIPPLGESRTYPWGEVWFPSGVPRWCAFGRLEEFTDAEWMSLANREIIDRGALRNGCDPTTGRMVMAVAYECYRPFEESGNPIPIRQASVSEPGGKVRMVTTGPWWLAVLQQPLCHGLREILAYHPSAHSCLMRCDQAWQSLHVLERLGIPKLEDGMSVLSSDLKEATDAIPHKVGKVLLSGFLEGLGRGDHDWITNFIGERTVFCEDGEIFTLRRGVMMGEPLSKICLVLLGLAMEELAFSEHEGLSLHRRDTPRCRWRAFHLGGDDHLAVGPVTYLRSITSNHRLFGSVISPVKHRMSSVYVVYTEKVLRIKDAVLNLKASQVDGNPANCTFIDSVKVRLLSPFSKATDTQNDKNVAIGKVRGIAATLKYFPSESIKRTVFDRVAYRFNHYIGSERHRTIRAVMSLPSELGGLGFAFDDRYLGRLPPIFNRAVRTVINGGGVGFRVRRILGQIFANRCPRGLVSNALMVDDYVEQMVEQFLDYPGSVDMVSSGDLWARLDPSGLMSFREFLEKASHDGWVSLHDIPRIAEKPFLMRKILEGSEVPEYFRTASNARRIAECWNSLEAIVDVLDPTEGELSPLEIREASRCAKHTVFVNLNEMTCAAVVDPTSSGYDPGDPWICADFIDLSMRELLTYGEPSLTVPL